jgi:penicillin amidase
MDLFRRQARGTLSELLGANLLGQDFLTADIFMRNTMYSDSELTELFEGLSEEGQTVLQAYSNGVNRRIMEIYSDFLLMPFEYWAGSILTFLQMNLGYNTLPQPWTPNDSIAWMALMQRFFDPEGSGATGQLDNYALLQTWSHVYGAEGPAMFADMRWLNDPSAQTMIPTMGKAHRVGKSSIPIIDVDAYPDMRQAADRLRSRFEQRDRALEAIGAKVGMGSYAWAVSGDKTASGNPIMYSGPQMPFWTPSICVEGSIRGGGYEVSGMAFPGAPAILIGRTPHHSWSMQVGHAHTLDYFLEAPQSVFLDRVETFYPAGGEPVQVTYYRSHHGPIVEPFPYDPENPPAIIVSYAYAHWGREAKGIEGFLQLAKAKSIEEFDQGVEMLAVSQHSTYADRDGNIAYWMSGWDPIRAPGVDPRFPQIGDGSQEWTGERRPRAHATNPEQGYFGGWNNKASADYMNAPNSAYYGPFHRAHVIDEYLASHDNLTYEEVRDLALNIATTDSFGAGGNTWAWIADAFKAAVAANSTPDRDAAIAMLDAWDGHFVAGGPSEWRFGMLRADAWVLQDAWIKEVLRLTFEDEFMMSGMDWSQQSKFILFNVLIRALQGSAATLPTYYNWFQDKSGSGKPTDAAEIIVLALDNVIADMGLGPYEAPRGTIDYTHDLLSKLDPAFEAWHSTPFSSRSTYAHVVEYGENGPVRIESMFPLGQSGALYYNGTLSPTFDPNYVTMIPAYDSFMPRPFPLFE